MPAALDRLVRQCLKKDPTERWQSAQDVALRLREIGEASPPAAGAWPTRKTWRLLVPAVVVVVLLALLAGH